MNKMVCGLAAAALFATATTASGAGFALYEGSAKGVAWGGAVMGRAVDGSANFYNPATISDFTNTVVSVGSGIEIPRASVRVDGKGAGHMDPGLFFLPPPSASNTGRTRSTGCGSRPRPTSRR